MGNNLKYLMFFTILTVIISTMALELGVSMSSDPDSLYSFTSLLNIEVGTGINGIIELIRVGFGIFTTFFKLLTFSIPGLPVIVSLFLWMFVFLPMTITIVWIFISAFTLTN